MLIRRAVLATGVALELEIFSFSSCPLTPDVSDSRRDARFLLRKESREDAVRRWVRASGVTEGARLTDVADGARLGSADEVAREERPLTEAASSLFAATLTTEPLGRILRAREDLGAVGGASLVVVLLASDITEEGRTTLGVEKIEDSRRRGAFAAGV